MISRKARLFIEASKPEMIQKIELMFGGESIWEDGNNFIPNKIHLIGMFDIANKYLFEGKLDRTETKRVVVEGEDPSIPDGVMAAFIPGQYKGVNRELIVVRHHQKDNFFVVLCCMIHEMIHMYDYFYGPMGKMIKDTFNRFELVGQLNWGFGYGSPDQCLQQARLSRLQLPDDIPNDGHPRQYQFPYVDVQKTLQTRKPQIVQKYKLSNDSMYDVHGSYFKSLAARANYIGLEVTDVFDPYKKHKLRIVTEDPDETPEDLRHINSKVEAAFNRIKDDGKRLEYRDDKNWFMEIV